MKWHLNKKTFSFSTESLSEHIPILIVGVKNGFPIPHDLNETHESDRHDVQLLIYSLLDLVQNRHYSFV